MNKLNSLKPLTKFQSKFMTENLKLNDFEHLLRHDRVGFLNEIVKAFQLNIPFQTFAFVKYASSFNPIWNFKDFSYEFIDNEILSGQGGACGVKNPFLCNFLTSLGFDASLVKGFGPLRARYYGHENQHTASVLKNVETQGDVIYVDVGCYAPLLRPVKLDYSNSFGASEEFQDIVTSKLVTAKSLENFLEENNIPSLFDVRHIVENSNKDETFFIWFLRNDALFRSVSPALNKVDIGAWLPYQIFPSSLKTFQDVIKFFENWPYDIQKMVDYAASICVTSGFGQSGDFVVFTSKKCVRYPFGHEVLKKSGFPKVAKDAEPLVVQLPQDELTALFNSEFPQLTDGFVYNLKYLNELKKVHKSLN